MTSAVTAGGAVGAPPAGLAKPRKARRSPLVGRLFLAPAFAFYAVFVLYPLAMAIQYSFYDWNGISVATPV